MKAPATKQAEKRSDAAMWQEGVPEVQEHSRDIRSDRGELTNSK